MIYVAPYAPWSSGAVCLECRSAVLTPADLPKHALVLCPACAAACYEGTEVVVDGDRLAVHPVLIPGDPIRQGSTPTGAMSSPRWVDCPRCGIARGDFCINPRPAGGFRRLPAFCNARLDLNLQRLRELQTWAIEIASPCCATPVCLVWRSAEDSLTWTGVPCFACHKTYTFQHYASGLVESRRPVDRLYPDKLEVVCWATKGADPWKKP